MSRSATSSAKEKSKDTEQIRMLQCGYASGFRDSRRSIVGTPRTGCASSSAECSRSGLLGKRREAVAVSPRRAGQAGDSIARNTAGGSADEFGGRGEVWDRIRQVVEDSSDGFGDFGGSEGCEEDGQSSPVTQSPYWGFRNIVDIPLGHPDNMRLMFALYNDFLEVAEENVGIRLLLIELDGVLKGATLTEKQRRVFALVFFEGYDYEEVSRKLRIVRASVASEVEESLKILAREACRRG